MQSGLYNLDSAGIVCTQVPKKHLFEQNKGVHRAQKFQEKMTADSWKYGRMIPENLKECHQPLKDLRTNTHVLVISCSNDQNPCQNLRFGRTHHLQKLSLGMMISLQQGMFRPLRELQGKLVPSPRDGDAAAVVSESELLARRATSGHAVL